MKQNSSAQVDKPRRAQFRGGCVSIMLLTLLGGSVGFAFDEVEPNDSFETASDATRKSKISGEIESGSGFRSDYFKIHSFNAFEYNISATARIVTGAFAGSEAFAFQLRELSLPPAARPENPRTSITGGDGSRRIVAEGSLKVFGPLFLEIGFPSEITSGIYEIEYTVTPYRSSRTFPYLIGKQIRYLPGNKVSIFISASSRYNLMRQLSVKATGNPRSRIVSNYFDVSYINTRDQGNFASTSRMEMVYEFTLRRPVTRVVAVAEESSGFTSRFSQKFRRKNSP